MRWVIAAVLAYFCYGSFGLVWEDWPDFGLELPETKHSLFIGLVCLTCLAALMFGWGI